jgi:hypothetical protein
MNKLQELEAARNLEPDCHYGAVGAGRYRALNELRCRKMALVRTSRVLLDRDPSEGPVRSERERLVPSHDNVGLPPMLAWPDPPPRLLVALVWTAASGELRELLAATGDALTSRCAASATAYRAAMIAEGGPPGDVTVTEELLAELGVWLRTLDAHTFAVLVQAAAHGTNVALKDQR